MKMSKDSLAEVYFVLCNLNKDEYSKIPVNIINTIKENRNLDYRLNINEDVSILEQPFLEETRAILFALFKKYLATPEQKEKIDIIECKENQKIELHKMQKYNTDNVFKSKEKDVQTNKDITNTVDIVEYKENIFKKIINKIKEILHR